MPQNREQHGLPVRRQALPQLFPLREEKSAARIQKIGHVEKFPEQAKLWMTGRVICDREQKFFVPHAVFAKPRCTRGGMEQRTGPTGVRQRHEIRRRGILERVVKVTRRRPADDFGFSESQDRGPARQQIRHTGRVCPSIRPAYGPARQKASSARSIDEWMEFGHHVGRLPSLFPEVVPIAKNPEYRPWRAARERAAGSRPAGRRPP